MRRFAFGAIAGSSVLVACGGAPFNALDGTPAPNPSPDASVDGASSAGSSSGGGEGGGGLEGASPLDARTPEDARTSGDASPLDAGGDSSVDSGACPADVFGRYDSITATGLGCGDLNTTAPQCIRRTSTACAARFVSNPNGGNIGAVNGDASLESDGSFVGAALDLGTIQRTGCTGAWDAQTSTMTVTCGGALPSSQSCVVSMVRAGACP